MMRPMLLGSTVLGTMGANMLEPSSTNVVRRAKQALEGNIVSNPLLQPAVDASHRHHQRLLQHGRRHLSGTLIGIDRR